MSARRFPVRYRRGPTNAESLLVHPITGQAFLISKEKVGHVFALPNPLRTQGNVARDIGRRMPAFVTDATFTGDGRFALLRTMTQSGVLVFNARSWSQVATIPAPAMDKGESVSVEPSGRSILIGREGTNSPLIRLTLPPAFAAAAPRRAPRCPASR